MPLNLTQFETTPAFPLMPLLIAGAIGQFAFEIYAWLISPFLFGTALEPANLVVALTNIFTGLEISYALGFALHTVIGAGFVLLVWALHKAFSLRLVWAGALGGLILWFVAQGILAPVVGRSFMMGFGPYTQSSFIAHVGMAWLMGFALHHLLTRKLQTMAA